MASAGSTASAAKEMQDEQLLARQALAETKGCIVFVERYGISVLAKVQTTEERMPVADRAAAGRQEVRRE